MRNVAMTLAYIGKALNDSLEAYNNKKEADEALEANRNASAKKVEEQDAAKDAPKKTPTRGGPVGLQNKWGNHNQNLAALATNTQFVQLVPKNAATIQKSVKSQNILDAVYHTDKAFWMAAEKSGYRLGDSADKVMVRYTFTSAGAQSLMQDYLICGSGDYAEDNEEQWKGETAHPNYTIWKTNEIGAFGVGANRLRQLASKCIKIEQVKK
jgi:hypothetical protein